MKRLVLFLWFAWGVWGLQANNVRIVEDVKAGTIENGVAQLTFKIAWDNSWRDDYNWDAVYVFLKVKRLTDTEWSHAYFMNANHTVSNGYAWWPAQHTTTDNVRQGMFIYRAAKGKGNSEVTATLLWNINQNGYNATEIQSGKIEMSLQCIEMVYVPQGAFYLGDGVSAKTFRKKLRQIQPEWDLIDYKDTTQKYSSSQLHTSVSSWWAYDVTAPANRVAEGYPHSGTSTGNCAFFAAGEGFWQVEFKTEKAVKYFGVSGLYNHNDYRPDTWHLAASNNGIDFTQISETYSANDWKQEGISYPVYNALPVKKMGPGNTYKSYKFYRIVFKRTSYGVALNNVAMTEVDISGLSDDGYIVDGRRMYMNETTGLYANDGTTWWQSNSPIYGSINDDNVTKYTGNTNVYPTGFEGFYVMKYELSQEQYVRFLNKLNNTQQRARTVDFLDNLNIGAYVYGDDVSNPSHRNGIVVGTRSNDVVIFACNLTKTGDKVSQDDDGQNVACNYVSVNDMLAYADWAGLRPLSEMEYEKMGRRPYPQLPDPNGWAGGSKSNMRLPTDGNFASGTVKGGPDERLASGNLNAGGKAAGPIRVGSFASTATTPQAAGASYWGVMDLSGNLAEYYYNANPSGRAFCDNSYAYNHGNGAIQSSGAHDVATTYWPTVAAAFGIRGGSYMSEMPEAMGQTSISDRSQVSEVTSMDMKNATTTFRLGHSYTFTPSGRVNSTSYLKLANGRTTEKGEVYDTACVGSTYTLIGTPLLDPSSGNPIDDGGKTSYIWYIYKAHNGMWQVIPNENGKDLTLTDLRSDRNELTNDATNERLQYFYVRRMAFSPNGAMHTTYNAKIYQVNPKYKLNRVSDTLRKNNTSLGFELKTGLPVNVSWTWKAGGPEASSLPLQYKNDVTRFLYIPQREHFDGVAGQTHVVVCDMNFFNKCRIRKELKVFVEKRPSVGVASNEITVNGSDPGKECGVVMQDMRAQGASRIYKTVKIGNRCWMAENLRYDGLSTGSGIKTGDASGEKYGRLYNWSTTVVNNACPNGWRLPTNAEVNELITTMGGSGIAGKHAKTSNYWTYNESYPALDTYGFGMIATRETINVVNAPDYTHLITSDNYYYQLHYANDAFTGPHGYASYYYMPIRCIKR